MPGSEPKDAQAEPVVVPTKARIVLKKAAVGRIRGIYEALSAGSGVVTSNRKQEEAMAHHEVHGSPHGDVGCI